MSGIPSLLLCGTFFVPVPLAAQVSPGPPALPIPGSEAGSQRWIVTFRTRSFDLEALAEAVSAPAAAAVVARLDTQAKADQKEFVAFVTREGGVVTNQWWIVNGCAIEIAPERLAEIREHPRVLRVEPDRYLRPAFIKTSTNGNNHRVDALHLAGVKGKGATIAILDTGLDAQTGSQSRPHRTFFVNGDPNNKTGGGLSGSRLLQNYQVGLQPADDILGHGTAVAAVAAGEKWSTSVTSDRGHAPLASIVGYSIADRTDGFALLTTMVTAWQRVASHKSLHGTVAANMSYEGTATPLSMEQQAMDAAARVADLLITVAAGNRGASSGFAHGATNVLAVGAVHANTRAVQASSARGPLAGDKEREYPNLVANGVQMVMPERDNEAVDRVGSGTSYSAPQVAGAAALFRSIRSAATALETRAAIIATTEDVSGKNRTPPYDTRNAYGYGYLRDDHLIALAQNKIPNLLTTSTLSSTTRFRNFNFQTTRGRYYAAAIAWNRQSTTTTQWSFLAMTVGQGRDLFRSENKRNTHQKVVWRAPSTGTAQISVLANSLETASVPFALVVTEALPSFEAGRITRFGLGCPSSTTLVPELFASGTVEIGRTYEVELVRADAGAVALFSVGLSNTRFGNLTLPLDLGPLGAPRCWLWNSIESVVPGVTSSAGTLQRRVGIPHDTAFIHAGLYHQSLVRNAAANPLGWVFTNALELTVGGDPN